jgi:SAM-dependent methyltransferase
MTIDPVWEKKYSLGHMERYPWDMVVSFISHNTPKDVSRKDIRVLEVGFGTGSNLWFAAREGYSVYGIEGSSSAVKRANKRFKKNGLTGDLRTGDFTKLPFDDNMFDLVIDRGALVCVGKQAQKQAVSEIHRCLCNGGRFLHNPYSDSDSSVRNCEKGEDGLSVNITGGLANSGHLCFNSRSELDDRFLVGWKLLQMQRRECIDMLDTSGEVRADWIVIVEKILE